jgi:hypothetical protein
VSEDGVALKPPEFGQGLAQQVEGGAECADGL